MPHACKHSNSFMWCILLLSMHMRIGEASNPGPSEGLTIGTFNPPGLMHKAFLLKEFHQGPAIWGACETHLLHPGIQKFRKELRFHQPQFCFSPSAPAPLRSASCAVIGGKHVGTGFLSTVPTRPLLNTWPDELHTSARIAANTFFSQNQLHGAVFYHTEQRQQKYELRPMKC